MNGDAIGLPDNFAAHAFERIDESHVALKRVAMQAGDGDAAACDCRRGKEVAGGRRVGFDVVMASLKWLRRDVEFGEIGGGGDDCAEVSEHLNGHLDVWLGNEFARDGQLYGFGAGGSGHQQTAEELAADVTVDRRGATAESFGGSIDADRRAGAVGVFEGDISAELSECLHEVADGALPHAIDAIEAIVTTSESTDGGQEADAGAAVFQPEVGSVGGNVACLPDDGAAATGDILIDGESEPAKAFDHHAGILAVEYAGEECGATGECSEDESAIGDAF